MAWTPVTIGFFAALGTMLVCLTVLELKRPTQMAKGWLPIATTRGDRVFISLLVAGFIHLIWLAVSDLPLWCASIIAAAVALLVIRNG